MFPSGPLLPTLALIVEVLFPFNQRPTATYKRHSANSVAMGHMHCVAEDLSQTDEAGVRAATPESLLGGDVAADKHGKAFALNLQGAAPVWAGTRLHATRDGHAVAPLTVTSLRDGAWTTDTEQIPEWWQV